MFQVKLIGILDYVHNWIENDINVAASVGH